MPLETSSSDFAYVKLFVAVLLAVTGGNLLSNWITARAVEYQLEVAASEASARLKQETARVQQAVATAQSQSQKEATAYAARVQQSRREDKVGIKLAQACAEWAKANQELQSYTTRTEQEKACARLNAYVQSGATPRE
jgi:hypothetical protein